MESVLCHDNFSSLIFYSASTFSGVSLTSRCSVEISRGALEVNSESVSSENRDDVGVIFLLSLKPFQDRSFLSPVCKSANSRQKVWTHEHPWCIRDVHRAELQESSMRALARLTDISEDLLVQYNADIVNIISFLWLFWKLFSSYPSKLPWQQQIAPIFQPKWAMSI